MVLGVVQDAAQGRVGPAHHALHAVGRADEVAFVDALHAAAADEDVLVVVGHAHHFVRHDLADREHQVVAAFPDQPIELGRPRAGPQALRRLAHEIGRDLADGNHAVSPVVLADQAAGQAGEHPLELPIGHGGVRAQGRHDVAQPAAEILVGQARQQPRHAVGPREIGRQGQDFPPRAQFFQRGKQRAAEVIAAQVGGRGTLCEKGGHYASGRDQAVSWV